MIDPVTAPPTLDAAIAEFRATLPGWWYSVCECSVSCDASCGPDRNWCDAHLLADRLFDEGFHADLKQPSTLAEALRHVMAQGVAAKAALADGVGQGPTSTTDLDAVPGTDHNPPDLGPARV